MRSSAPPSDGSTEVAARERLGIPDSASEVVVVTESTHWDPDWLLRADRYYRLCVRPTLDRALDALRADSRRVFSLECVFFVDRYWRDRPERRDQFRLLVNEGRLRFTGCGVTTPDTLLPEDELLLRDLLLGQEWLRRRGMDQEPRLLYLPDSFGHSPGLPAMLRAAGIDQAAVCRIDGMRFPGADLESASRFPRPGSTAAQLLGAGTADFMWRAPDGSEVLTHWMAHGYGHGDMIASGGLTRVLGLPLSWPDRRPARVDGRIGLVLEDLRTIALTPYRLLAIGFDFVRPIPDLVGLLDGWNERNHERTGTWLVNAGIDDHLDLVRHHRKRLPTLEVDPNPYWMGFYATRPDLKGAARELGRRLVARDAALAAGHVVPAPPGDDDDPMADPWWVAATANHHDFITGTSPDRVAVDEQATWLTTAIAACPWPDAWGTASNAGGAAVPPTTRQDRNGLVVETGWGTALFDPRRGAALVSLRDRDGVEQLDGPSLTLSSYTDSGGLWRLGNEIHGGRWARRDDSSRHPATIDAILGADDRVDLHVTVVCDGRTASLIHSVDAASPSIVTRTWVNAPRRRTVTLVTCPRGSASTVTMHQPGGVVDRPLERWYDPTYWPLHSFAVTGSADEPSGPRGAIAIGVAAPTGLHVDSDGRTEVIVARTPFKEMAFGFVPVMAPAWVWRWPPQTATVALTWLGHRHRDDRPAAIEAGRRVAAAADRAAGRHTPRWPVVVSDPEAEIIAAKRAHRGDGTVIRIRDWSSTLDNRVVRVTLDRSPTTEIAAAWLTDSRERDLEPLPVDAVGASVPLTHHLTTIRLVTRSVTPHRPQR